jgi:hypothetical protein
MGFNVPTNSFLKMDSGKVQVQEAVPLSVAANGKFTETEASSTKRQYVVTFVCNLLSVSYGASCGWTSPSLPILESDRTSLPSGPITSEGKDFQ